MNSLGETLQSFKSDRREALPNELQCPVCHWVLTTHPSFEAWARRRGLTEFERAICCCRCTETQKAQEKERHLLMDAANLPHRYDGTGPRIFENLELIPELELARQVCWEFANKTGSPILMVSGAKGCGKTHLLEATARHALSLGESVRYENAVDLLDRVRSTYSESSQTTTDGMLVQYRNVSLLVLDDVGAQRETEWAEERLYALVDARYRDGRRLLVATNSLLSGVADSRTWSRLLDSTTGVARQVSIAAGNYRKP